MEKTSILKDIVTRYEKGVDPWRLFPVQQACMCDALKEPPGSPVSDALAQDIFNQAMYESNVYQRRCAFVHMPAIYPNDHTELSQSRVKDQLKDYVSAVIKQARLSAESGWGYERPLDLLELTGPGLYTLHEKDIAILTERILKQYIYSSETTVRTTLAPYRINAQSAACLKGAGINNLMLHYTGQHSFVNEDQIKTLCFAIESSFDAGIDRTGVVLRYDHPGCETQTFIQMMAMLSRLPIREIGLYSLGHSNGEAQVAKDYTTRLKADEFLRAHGWLRLSGWRYRRDDELPLFNEHLSEADHDILGLGLGASGRMGQLIYQTTEDIEEYIDAIDHDHQPEVSMVCLSENYLRLVDAMGLIKSPYIDKLDWPLNTWLLNQLIAMDLVREEGEQLMLTAAGSFWAGNIAEVIMQEVKSLYPASVEETD